MKTKKEKKVKSGVVKKAVFSVMDRGLFNNGLKEERVFEVEAHASTVHAFSYYCPARQYIQDLTRDLEKYKANMGAAFFCCVFFGAAALAIAFAWLNVLNGRI